MSGLVIFATKYGSTEEYTRLIAEKLNTEALRASEATSEALRRADYLILGSPIYGYSVLPEMEEFLRRFGKEIEKIPTAAFVVCGDTLWNPKAGEGGHGNLTKLTDLMPAEPFATAVLGGRMVMEELDDEDRPRIRAFYERIGREATGFDRMDTEAALDFVENIKVKLGL